MRRLLCILFLGAAAGSPAAIAQSEFTFVGRAYALPGGGATSFALRCPPGMVLSQVHHSADAGFAPAEGDVNIRIVDRGGVPVTLEDPALVRATEGGVDVAILSTAPRRESFGEVIVFCVLQTLVTDVVSAQASLDPGATATLDGMCPGSTVAVGELHPTVGFRDEVRSYLYGAPPAVTQVDALADGDQIPPSGMRLRATNTTQSPATLRMATLCGALGNARTLVTSSATSPGPLSLAAPVPDDRLFLGMTAVVGGGGNVDRVGVWSASGVVLPELSYVSGAPEIRDRVKGLFVGGNVPASSRSVVGALVIPAPAPAPPTIVDVVEFHHPVLDHYFITAIPKEISDLDSGVHVGWERTGEAFRVYASGSSGRTGRQPVCRAYGDPLAGLDSHFYSVSPDECVATLRGFNGAWLLEASEVFQADAPNDVTGACLGGVPIYRLWNGRSDSNHRYVSSLALRTFMMGAGWQSEGYGPNGVAICALP